LFQVSKEMEKLMYINAIQLSMIQDKLMRRNVEIENHIKHFQVLNVQS